MPASAADGSPDEPSTSQIAALDRTHLGNLPGTEVEAALEKAKATGGRVIIDSRTSEFSETAATPDGHLSQTIHPDQQRTKKNGTWADLDATLAVNPDGSYSPKTVPGGVTLSPGGSQQLATLASPSGEELSLTSPFVLSSATVSGDSLLYDVAPDTTLKVSADKFGGVSTVLILKTAQAAANPALKTLHFGIGTKGLTIAADADSLSVKAADGTVRWHAPTPRMWDSSTGTTMAPRLAGAARRPAASAATAPTASSANGPGPGARVAEMPVKAGGNGIDLSTDQDILTNGTGPWYIDPSWIPTSPGADLWNWVQSANPSLNNDNRTGSADSDHPGVGECGTYPYGGSCIPSSINRTYYRFDLSGLGGATVNSAQLNLAEYTSADWSCTKTYDVDVYRTDWLTPGTTWNSQPTWREGQGTQSVGGSGSDGCYSNVPFTYNVTSAVASQAGGSVSFVVTAADESDANAFKRLTYQPNLTIQYDRYPDTPQNPQTGPIHPRTVVPNVTDYEACADVPLSTYGWITSSGLQLNSTVSSPAQGQLGEWIDIWDNADGSKIVGDGRSALVSSGSTASYQLPTGTLKDGHFYGWLTYADDTLLRSQHPSTVCHFRVDLTPPVLQLPPSTKQLTDTELNTQFPPSGNGQTTRLKVGQTGYVPFSATDPNPSGLQSSGLAAVHWSFDPQMASGVQHAYAPNLPSQLAVTPTHWGTNIVYVQAEDNAGNRSPVVSYSFYVPWAATPLAYGDVSGDGRSDVLNPDPRTGDLLDYGQAITFTAPSTVPGVNGAPSAPRIAATAAQAPGANGWKNLRVSHRGTKNAAGAVDALFVHQDPSNAARDNGGSDLFYFPNNLQANGTFNADFSTIGRPDCVTGLGTSCADYGNVASWATVSQITPIGSANAKLTPTDKLTEGTGVLVIEKGNLWYYPAGSAGTVNSAGQITYFGKPIELTTGGTWAGNDLMIPGDTLGKGKPALWVRARDTVGGFTAGDILQYELTFASATDSNGQSYTMISGLATTSPARIGWGLTSTEFPTVGAVGDLTGDDIPDLWAAGPTGRIEVWPGATSDGTRNSPVVVTLRRSRQWPLSPTVKGEDVSGGTLGDPAAPTNVTWSTDKPTNSGLDGSAHFDGTGYLVSNANPVLTTGSYSVSAWVKLDKSDNWYSVMSQTNQGRSPYYLMYSKTAKTWEFDGTSTDSPSTTDYYTARSSTPAQLGVWTHLVGTYDSTTHAMTLYVNGAYAGSATNPAAWTSNGRLSIGANTYPDPKAAPDSQFAGSIADARIYSYALGADQVATIYNNS
ncbi:LamG-like jellyroll fold domain-containing protein [Kitasatospora sp. GP82]|uniref:LamG-like jellyroll fold domain-containing protein n=1 Tax=Kitasatospora sp. GP82 TaxID=3035089 RepID=UPI002473A066|nr:LamG-like jellyroll fold domain-containing protein [Kitasatospora sp. GP82]